MDSRAGLLHAWDCTFDVEDWYPPLDAALKGVTSEQASWRSEGEATNTIWQLVSHLTHYKKQFLHNLKEEANAATANDFSFSSTLHGEEQWQTTVADLDGVHRQIHEELSRLNEDGLNQKIGETRIGQWATSLIMHDAYHTGQIVLIRKLQGSWASANCS